MTGVLKFNKSLVISGAVFAISAPLLAFSGVKLSTRAPIVEQLNREAATAREKLGADTANIRLDGLKCAASTKDVKTCFNNETAALAKVTENVNHLDAAAKGAKTSTTAFGFLAVFSFIAAGVSALQLVPGLRGLFRKKEPQEQQELAQGVSQ
ncbi:MAG: hypothetical protein AABW86_03635 [Candidatus Micrarchaeota archaeon]